jgi:hypothetical protein
MTPEQKQVLVGGSLKGLKQSQALIWKGQVDATIALFLFHHSEKIKFQATFKSQIATEF